MATEHELWVVDRFEGGLAVLVGDEDGVIEVQAGHLPRGASAGDVLRISRDAQGVIRWGATVVDAEATAARREEAREILNELRGRDPGGDVVL